MKIDDTLNFIYSAQPTDALPGLILVLEIIYLVESQIYSILTRHCLGLGAFEAE